MSPLYIVMDNNTGASFSQQLSILTVNELRGLCQGVLPLNRATVSRKDKIIAAISSHTSNDIRVAAIEMATKKRNLNQSADSAHQIIRKRKRQEEYNNRRVTQRLEEEISIFEEEGNIESFMEIPAHQELKQIYRNFYNATSQSAVQICVCGVCGREMMLSDGVIESLLAEIPNGHRLVPKFQHPQHDLFEKMLLEPAGVYTMGNKTFVKICRSCWKELNKPSCSDVGSDSKPPKFSLANNLWIGKIPWCLQILTFPEQLLLAQLYPRVYVFKLFPKGGGRREAATLQRGMRGTVSTYDLDVQGIASMLTGNLLPRPLSILASLISITFIGLGDLEKKWIRTMFRVRRHVICAALCWLKEHNPKYYGDVIIDPIHLAALPEDDVPVEIMGVIRKSSSVGITTQESAGYAPCYEEDFDLPEDKLISVYQDPKDSEQEMEGSVGGAGE